MKRLLVIALLAAGAALSQTAPKVDIARLDYGLAARLLAPGVWVVEGTNADFSPANGCNIINTGFIATGAGVIVVNTGPSKRYGEQLRALIERTVREPVVQVIHLNLHPDYFLGNQAFADVPRLATDSTRAGMAREAKAYEDNLYRLCGDWMKGTQAVLPSGTAMLGPLRVGGREMELREYRGHTDSDLVLVDKASGVVFAGGLVFAQRIPTTPHAQVGAWLGSLQSFSALPLKTLVPSHGPVRNDASAVGQTQRYLQWLDRRFTQAAEQGVEMNELLRAEVPAEFLGWAAFGTEYTRNVAHLYPRYEQAVLGGGKAKP
ncbi:quinoprotein relay system zinc metallohydrolase 1 [Piscinibacter sp.]|uniref:quinoprotein relay system zinc metallohydrolase 1 n=1 Tax=Piscinibacter sp. TaxID=1903157 RepID=UPI001B5A2A83|nr:quinoprotein relay system zinc metallohydrolase 1 [Piscinibacter sp.]MBK7530718.1 quinoprotein relay system zinc metallohydrolase 1 [Piscinibacter sp.]MBP6542243.1 quinoprotein relay system zinc metallohydrolase 1 [Piscinibacter sp.]